MRFGQLRVGMEAIIPTDNPHPGEPWMVVEVVTCRAMVAGPPGEWPWVYPAAQVRFERWCGCTVSVMGPQTAPVQVSAMEV